MLSFLRKRIIPIQFYLLLIFSFSICLSTSITSITAILIILSWIIEGKYRQKIEEILLNPVCMAVVFYLIFLFLGLLWSDNLINGLSIIKKHWKLILLPILLTTVRHKDRVWHVSAFVAGVSLYMLATYCSWFDWLQYKDVNSEHITKGTFHVVYNPMLAFSIYLLLHAFIWGGLRKMQRWPILILAICMSLNMFITEGRAGQLAFFVLIALLLLQLFRKNYVKAIAATAVCLSCLFFTGYTLSPTFHKRVDQAAKEFAEHKENPATSIGYRLLYWNYSWIMISHSPWIGVGTGGFEQAYAEINNQLSPKISPTVNPHNQYFYTGCQLGLIGLTFLLLIFAAQMQQSRTRQDGWHRIYIAFPVFFLTIMLTESYLVVYETAFLFALFTALLYKYSPDELEQKLLYRRAKPGEKYWLILSYRANIPNNACSQHLDDRLFHLKQKGITPILLTSTLGKKKLDAYHFRTFSIAPSGIRFEIRHFLRKRLQKRWQFKVVETLLLIPVYPFYLIEKILINLESEWSWFVMASIRGIWLRWRFKPEVMYSTGGSASAHVAALIIQYFLPVTWIAETQDPLVHDQEWQRNWLVYRLYQQLEKIICHRSNAFIFLTQRALQNATQRVGKPFRGYVIYPGSPLEQLPNKEYQKGAKCRFAHFGSLAGTRNLVVFLEALELTLKQRPEYRKLISIDLFGSLDGASEKKILQLGYEDLVVYHGLVDRKVALEAMQTADCLLLIQNTTFFSSETIPSKVYEYLICSRPILGLTYNNEELSRMLQANNHFVAAADNVNQVRQQLEEILQAYTQTSFTWTKDPYVYTVDKAVEQLVDIAYTP